MKIHNPNFMTFNTLIFIASPIVVFLLIKLFLKQKYPQKYEQKKYHPVAGTMFHHLLHFNKIHHYMTDLAAKYKTYRILAPFRNEVYTSDPANVEYILKTNFENYGKVYICWTAFFNETYICFTVFECCMKLDDTINEFGCS